MAVSMLSIKGYIFTSARDDKPPKTEFHMKPLGVGDYMTVFAAFQMIAPSGDVAKNKEVAASILSLDGKEALAVIMRYLQEHITEVKNFMDEDGQMKSGPGSEYWHRVDTFTAVEIVADAIFRSKTPLDTEKNSE